MSEAIIYSCDRCKKSVTKDRSYWMTLKERFRDDKVWDLCPDCKEKFLLFLKNKA